ALDMKPWLRSDTAPASPWTYQTRGVSCFGVRSTVTGAGTCPRPCPANSASPSATASHSSHSTMRSRGCRSQPQGSPASPRRSGGRASITAGALPSSNRTGLAALELDVGADRVDPRARAGLVGRARRGARNADAGQRRAGRLDRQAAAERSDARNLADRAHRLARLRLRGEFGGGNANRRRPPRLVGGGIDGVRTGEAVAQVDLHDAAAIADCHADLVAGLAAGLEPRLR